MAGLSPQKPFWLDLKEENTGNRHSKLQDVSFNEEPWACWLTSVQHSVAVSQRKAWGKFSMPGSLPSMDWTGDVLSSVHREGGAPALCPGQALAYPLPPPHGLRL